ncbi:phosphoribosyltransferase [Caminibacter mediatlanticus TB-2]|uniref:Phosphoribosyltransferase n=1 Tax=Caminibacter mediatlanticus TB-2 TaxID=391592 RepID=A0ABX5V7C9_9BACT|nr:phosphoribosyltransferase family protein [Caminibacter mediatlanticus]QCT94190.1 phosphoribosyltransferase [Caminibacter mediatlanticus TB-2]
MKEFYSFNDFSKDIEILANKIKGYNADALLAIARGGLTLGHFLAERLNTREVYAINAISYEGDKKLGYVKIFNLPNLKHKKKIVLVDDISDSGETLKAVKELITKTYPQIEIKTATIFYKEKTKVMPDFYIKEAKNWIVFFWDSEGQEITKKSIKG